MNPLERQFALAISTGRAGACLLVASLLLGACGSSIDGDNAGIAGPQEPKTLAAEPASFNRDERPVASQHASCETDGRVICSMPRLRARAMRSGWIAQHHQWRRDGVDIPGTNQPSYVPGDADAAEAGAHYTVEITDGAGRTFTLPGVPAMVGNHSPVTRR